MDSVAAVLFVLICLGYLCGPVALWLAFRRWYFLAVLVGALSCWLGIFWFVTIYTEWKYLGLGSAACGLYAMYKTAKMIT
jgi:hypothetical protein